MELVHACSKERLPLMIGGDFNIICIAQEKKKTMIHTMKDGPSCSMPLLMA